MSASMSQSLCDEALISVRLVTMDHYMISPSPSTSNHFDPGYSMFRSATIDKVPVLRVFGTTLAGQKACLHIHGIFPYLYVPMPAGDLPGFLYRLASSLDKALNMTKYGSSYKESNYDDYRQHHVYKVVEVTGIPYYGYHSRQHRFAKIYFYNPWDLRKASDLLASGSVMGQVLQPHYGHIPYTLQFMMDYNLQGMSLIHVKAAKFRHPEPAVTYEEASQIMFWSAGAKDPNERLFNLQDMTKDMLGPDDMPPMTTCQIELDAVAADILNSNEELVNSGPLSGKKKSGNPGLEIIWEDERLRRIAHDIDFEENPLTPPESPPRQRSPTALTDSEKFWNDRFHEALEAWREKGVFDDTSQDATPSTDDLDATANFDPNAKVIVYPEEVANESILQTASFVEKHLSSLTLERNYETEEEEDIFLDKTDFFDDTIIDEEAISQLLDEETKKSDEKSPVILDSDDHELIELLKELNDESISQESDSSSSLILSQLSQLSKEKLEQETVESLEMSQIVWDDDDIFENEDTESSNDRKNAPIDDFDDDSFWESYDFESLLKK